MILDHDGKPVEQPPKPCGFGNFSIPEEYRLGTVSLPYVPQPAKVLVAWYRQNENEVDTRLNNG